MEIKKTRFTREFEIIEVPFCFSSFSLWQLFVFVIPYNAYKEKGINNVAIWKKLGKQKACALDSGYTGEQIEGDSLVYKVKMLPPDPPN